MSPQPLPLFQESAVTTAPQATSESSRAIEAADFPFEDFSEIAELESWRKEVHRPVYHVHKWWAQRLGSVFRAIVLGTFAPAGTNLLDAFYSPHRIPAALIFDPFMGSGTTVGEVLKLGGRAIGFDINPVAHFLVRNALNLPSREALLETFADIERDTAPRIRCFYQARLPETDELTPVLYYFWVKGVPCPACSDRVDLFNSYIFAQHAYPKRYPTAQAVCPRCGDVTQGRYDAQRLRCTSCSETFDTTGPARGQRATCSSCKETFPIAKAVHAAGGPPEHRLYAKLLLTPTGEKRYVRADDYDRALFARAVRTLKTRPVSYPVACIDPGYNTNQVLNYNYTRWDQMFNARQLLALSILADRIREIPDERTRAAFCCLFSGTLEFNNMFASFKGEGTGAVRHMFSHHILKPERTPIEANVWGTPKSSGAFSTLFRSRLLRALDYSEAPFEIRPISTVQRPSTAKVHGLSDPLSYVAARSFKAFRSSTRLYLRCADSAHTDLPPEFVDAVITDPPFFDNVHYSQLADFFYVWQRSILGARDEYTPVTTRSPAEVQDSNPHAFTDRLTAVWRECHRVLKSHGVLVFTYHHSRPEGWRSVLLSLVDADFTIVRAHPIKSEMSVGAPKHQAREPIDLDMIIVCHKRSAVSTTRPSAEDVLADAANEARRQLRRLSARRRQLSRGDIRVVLTAQVVTKLSALPAPDALALFDEVTPLLDPAIASLVPLA